jgi:hypothetical protein
MDRSVAVPRTVVFIRWTTGKPEEDFCREISLGWIPRVGDTLSFCMDGHSEPFCLYSLIVDSIQWFEDAPSIIEVCMEKVQPNQSRDDFIELMRSLGWIWRDEFEGMSNATT